MNSDIFDRIQQNIDSLYAQGYKATMIITTPDGTMIKLLGKDALSTLEGSEAVSTGHQDQAYR